jgi:hypothetical protein
MPEVSRAFEFRACAWVCGPVSSILAQDLISTALEIAVMSRDVSWNPFAAAHVGHHPSACTGGPGIQHQQGVRTFLYRSGKVKANALHCAELLPTPVLHGVSSRWLSRRQILQPVIWVPLNCRVYSFRFEVDQP